MSKDGLGSFIRVYGNVWLILQPSRQLAMPTVEEVAAMEATCETSDGEPGSVVWAFSVVSGVMTSALASFLFE